MWKVFTVEAEEVAESRYPESDTIYGYGAVREAFEAGVWWATLERTAGAVLLPPKEDR
ncbi:hypothetical protein D3C79_1055180 [compost metagenome]